MTEFEQIKNDKIIIDIYNQISKVENQNKGWAHHNLQHVINVANLVEKLLTDLKYDKQFIEEAKIAAILHDTGCTKGKEGHALRSYEFAKQYLKNNNIKLENENLVLEAIKNHSEGFETNNIIALTLILSDKLDIKYTRVTEEGYKITGMKELQYIKDINIEIKNNNLTIDFICENKMNFLELEEFYFMKKVFKAIKAFSEKMQLKPTVLINNEKWQKFYNEII